MRQGSLWLQEEGNLVCVASYPSDEYQQPPPVIQQVFTTAEPKYQGSIEVVAPLITRSKTIGVLSMNHAQDEPSPALISITSSWIAHMLDQMQLTLQVQAQQQQLQEVMRQQSELLSFISHDLRNPMASIKGYADLLLRRSARLAEDPNRRGLEIISQQVVRMTTLLNQVLDMMRLNNKQLPMHRRPDQLSRLTQHVLTDLMRELPEDTISLLESELILPCKIDSTRMYQALEYMVNGVFQYAVSTSPIIASLEQRGQEGILKLTNPGIEQMAAQQEQLFEPRFRTQRGETTAHTGMHLFMAQQIVLQHDGRMWFEQTPNNEWHFCIALPLSSDTNP